MAIADKTFDVKLKQFIKRAENDDSEDSADDAKDKMNTTVQQLVDYRNELFELKEQNKMIGEQNMDSKDMKLLTNEIGNLLDAKFEKKFDKRFDGLETNLKNIEKSVNQTCKDGKCFTTTLETLQEKLDEIDNVKTEVAELKSGVGEEMKSVNDSVSKMTESFTESISGINKDFTESISGVNKRLDDTCTGIDCITKRFTEEDDMVQCPNEECNHIFSLSANTVGDTVVCPNCNKVSKLE